VDEDAIDYAKKLLHVQGIPVAANGKAMDPDRNVYAAVARLLKRPPGSHPEGRSNS
jgi:hypothetical protein